MNSNAIKNIYLAQVASDAGKGIYMLDASYLGGAWEKEISIAQDAGYAMKDSYLENACKIISRSKDPDIRFFVTRDKQKIADFIVYFDIKINGKRMQASFHSFNKHWSKWIKPSTSSRGSWDHKNSRLTCWRAARYVLASGGSNGLPTR